MSTLVTYDIYKTYINPKATGTQILFVSRCIVLAFGIFMGVLAIILNQAGVSLGWMYLVMGVLIGSAVIPIANVLLWRKANAVGAIAGCLIGMIAGERWGGWARGCSAISSLLACSGSIVECAATTPESTVRKIPGIPARDTWNTPSLEAVELLQQLLFPMLAMTQCCRIHRS